MPKNTSIKFDMYELDIHIPEHDEFSDLDSGFTLQNGNIVIQKFKSMINGTAYYKHYIYSDDGTSITTSPGDTTDYRLVFETDQGDIIVTNSLGITTMFDSTWNCKDTNDDLTFYSGYPLDGGRYFAVNDEFMIDYEYAHGVDSVEEPVRFSLYRYTEKLTDCVFSKIVQCDNGFECFFSDYSSGKESIFIEASDQVLIESNDICSSIDSKSQKYIYVDKNNTPLFDASFDFISSPRYNRSIAYTHNNVYLIRPQNRENS